MHRSRALGRSEVALGERVDRVAGELADLRQLVVHHRDHLLEPAQILAREPVAVVVNGRLVAEPDDDVDGDLVAHIQTDGGVAVVQELDADGPLLLLEHVMLETHLEADLVGLGVHADHQEERVLRDDLDVAHGVVATPGAVLVGEASTAHALVEVDLAVDEEVQVAGIVTGLGHEPLL